MIILFQHLQLYVGVDIFIGQVLMIVSPVDLDIICHMTATRFWIAQNVLRENLHQILGEIIVMNVVQDSIAVKEPLDVMYAVLVTVVLVDRIRHHVLLAGPVKQEPPTASPVPQAVSQLQLVAAPASHAVQDLTVKLGLQAVRHALLDITVLGEWIGSHVELAASVDLE